MTKRETIKALSVLWLFAIILVIQVSLATAAFLACATWVILSIGALLIFLNPQAIPQEPKPEISVDDII